jgi:glycosyltransferase involved in cell wall biosynthesis
VAAQFKKRGVDAEFFVIGEGPDFVSLEKQAREMDVSDCVRFVGFQNSTAAWLASMDAMVLLSDHEGMPMVVLEALALGVPVIARSVGGLPEILGDVSNCVLVSGIDPVGIADAAIKFLTLHNISESRHVRLPARYSSESMARAYVLVYGELRSTQLPQDTMHRQI